jgi:hypothetical protein
LPCDPFLDLTQWESTGELLTMETAHSFFNFFHHQLGQKATVLCNIYGGTEMMDNICETFQNWDQVVSISNQASVMSNAVESLIRDLFQFGK